MFVTIHNVHFIVYNSYWVQNTKQNKLFYTHYLIINVPFFKLYQLIRFNIFIKELIQLFSIPTSVMSAVTFFFRSLFVLSCSKGHLKKLAGCYLPHKDGLTFVTWTFSSQKASAGNEHCSTEHFKIIVIV